MIYLKYSHCCALNQLIYEHNNIITETKQQIYYNLKSFIKKERRNYSTTNDASFTSLIAYSIPNEENYEKALTLIGFKHISTIPRRKVSGEGNVKLWLFNWKTRLKTIKDEDLQ
jgi:hypothetical protein